MKKYSSQVRKRYSIHPSVFWGLNTLISGNGTIQIGEKSYIGRNSFVTSEPKGKKVIIGKNCSISHNVHIRTEIHKRKYHYKDEYVAPPEGADIIIGDYVWIGANVFIGGGITIGDNSIIGANSVVTHDIPPDTIYGGVPAKLIRNKKEYLNQ